MGLFKKKVVKEIDGPMWEPLANVHKIGVTPLSKEVRYVERDGTLGTNCAA